MGPVVSPAEVMMELKLKLPGAPLAAAAARSVVERLGDHVPGDMLDNARLLISELVTNAVLHGGARAGGDVRVRILTTAQSIRFEVCDGGRGFQAEHPHLEQDQIGGWGLYLVDQLADRWGVDTEGGCMVWFELDRRPAVDAVA